ncbi:hypothetical protein [Aeromonas schubertii]|uniref:hypothetical protein n=1 Tax=Aeromonas schubertii TaxID=652 RepID=UPI001D050384|nr:hypothetical protein [Aeromonas schubertii]
MFSWTLSPSRRFLAIIVVVLAGALGGIGLVQYRQFVDLNINANQGNDSVMWNYTQLYSESLRLQNALLLWRPGEESQLQLRYDIFASRVELAFTGRDRQLLRNSPCFTRWCTGCAAMWRWRMCGSGSSPRPGSIARRWRRCSRRCQAYWRGCNP